MNKSKKAGFSLIELGVVITVIVILAAILFPAITRVQERGREVRCASNLRQLHAAAMSYLSAHGEFPGAADYVSYQRFTPANNGATVRRGWVASHPDAYGHAWWYERGGEFGTWSVTNGTLFRYVGDGGDESVYICPSMSRLAQRTLTGAQRNLTRSYGINPSVAGQRLHGVSGPSRTMMFSEQGLQNMGGGRTFLAGGDNGPHAPPPPPPSDAYWNGADTYARRYNLRVDGAIDYDYTAINLREWIGAYHGPSPNQANAGRGNVVFVDGHVEQVVYTHTIAVARGNWEDGAPTP